MKDRIRHTNAHAALYEAIPSAHVGRVAQLVGVTPDEVLRWRREPESTDNPTATGRRSPLDRMLDLIDAIYLPNPAGAGIVVDVLSARLAELRRTHLRDGWDALQTLEDVLNGTAGVLHELRDGQATDRDVKAMLKLRSVLDEAIEHARAAYQAEGKARR